MRNAALEQCVDEKTGYNILHVKFISLPLDSLLASWLTLPREPDGSNLWSSGAWTLKPCCLYLCLLGRSLSSRSPGWKTTRRDPAAPAQVPDVWVREAIHDHASTDQPPATAAAQASLGAPPTQSTHWTVRNNKCRYKDPQAGKVLVPSEYSLEAVAWAECNMFYLRSHFNLFRILYSSVFPPLRTG